MEQRSATVCHMVEANEPGRAEGKGSAVEWTNAFRGAEGRARAFGVIG